MATRSIVPRADGEGSLGTTAKKWGSVNSVNMNLDGFDVAKLLLLRKNSTAYGYNEMAVARSLGAGLILQCTTAGTSGAIEPDCSSVSVGDTVTDGTVVWTCNILGGAGTGHSIGEIFPYAGTTQPPGALLCNGAAVSRTMYPDLFDEIGTKYGSGDGSTTFNLPNLLDAALMNGAYTKTTYETAGSATFTASKTGWYKITVKGAGGGGAGGGGTSTPSARGGGGGGEGGTTIAYEKLTAGQTASVVIGAGGAKGANSTAGSNGGDSTVTVNLSTLTGGGGHGGAVDYGGVGGAGTIPGAPGGTSTYAANNSDATGGSGGGNGGANSVWGIAASPGVSGGGGAGGSAANASVIYAASDGGDGYAWIEYIGASEPYFIQAFNASTDPALVDLTQIAQDLANKLTREQTPAFNKRDIVTTSGTYTAPVTGWYRITVKGGGGGGSRSTTYSIGSYGGNGGGEGGTTIGYEKMTAGDTATVVVGAGGSGGVSGHDAGENGGNSSVTVNSTTYTGGGGNGATTAHAGLGGSGTVVGDTGQTGPTLITTSAAYSVSGGVGGGENGGAGGTSQFNTQSNGTAGGDGYVWFEYFAAV